MKWKKLGQLYSPEYNNNHPKLLSHAANPLPILLENDTYRIFFSGRDEQNRSSVGAVDIDIIQRKIIKTHLEPFFQHGELGSFYEHGVSIGNCYENKGVRYILFMGWQNHSQQHWRGDVGRLILHDDLTLSLDTDTPFMGTDQIDPISLSYPCVIGNSSNGYQMWYGSTINWDAGNNEMIHVLNYASSKDGHYWEKTGISLPYELNIAQAFSKPSVLKDKDNYKMWFSYRGIPGLKYRIGYAESTEGKDWILKNEEVGIDVSESGWDSEMICYPFIFDHKGERYMLYNGNGYGKTGFGLAILERK